ncbi:MAG: hypothetical protein AAGA69_05965, partial [Pseudomonadota bacterium]
MIFTLTELVAYPERLRYRDDEEGRQHMTQNYNLGGVQRPDYEREKPKKERKGRLGLALKIFGGLFAFGVVAALVAMIGVFLWVQSLVPDLPDEQVLAEYEPPVTTRVHAGNGELVA